MSNIEWDRRSLLTRLPDPQRTPTVTYNPSFAELRSLAAHDETTTEFGSPSYVSAFRSRSADQTTNAVDDGLTRDDWDLLTDACSVIDSREFVCVDRLVGRHPDATFCCRLYVPSKYARIALAWAKLLDPAKGKEPDFVTIQLPEHERLAIRVLPDAGLTVVLGTDYIGEAKKSFLRLFMYRTKRTGGLGLHAGSKRVRLTDANGDMREVGQLFLGLSATGKSTLTAHDYGLDGEEEEAIMLQDDVCALLPDGTVAGSEGAGLYIKTIGLDERNHACLYESATHESAVFENVAVDDDGSVHFDEPRYGSNGRAIVQRSAMRSASDQITLDDVDQCFFITRNPLAPPVEKLGETDAAAAFMLGESIETSAGNPDRAGESIRVVGTNPFIIGSKGAEGNRFRELIATLGIDCFRINTGYVGSNATDIGVRETVTILTEIARGTVEWTVDDRTGQTIPSSVPGLDIGSFYVPDHVDDFDSVVADLRQERRRYLRQFDDLDEDIVESVV